MPFIPGDLKIKEKVTLRKYEGDGPDDRTDEPIETVIIEDGKITQVIKRNDQNATN